MNRSITTARAANSFTPGNLVIYRVGDGSAAPGSAATAVFLDEYTPTGTFVQSIPLPTAVGGANKRLTASGTATSEGLLTLSADGHYLIAEGYDAAPATASITTSTSATVNRVIGRIDSAGNVDTTTALTDAISGGNPRSATSTDGTNLWIAGTSSGGGIRYATFGATTSTTVSTTVTNLRQTNIFNGQLYTTSASGAFRLATVGSGKPTNSGNTIVNLPGFPTSTGSPYGYFFAHLNGAGSTPDTVYVADDSALASGGGIQKYSLVGSSWVASGVIGFGSALRSLVGTVSGTSVTLYISGSSGNNGTLYTLVDNSGYNATITGTLTSLANAPTNKIFRGIAFAPTSNASTNPSGTGSASPSSVAQGASTTLTVSVSPGTNPASTGLAVTVDLSSIGGSATQQFFDDGSNGDATPGNNVFTFQTTIPLVTAVGPKTLPATITDAQSRPGSASISLNVTASSTPPTGVGLAAPGSMQAGNTTLLTVTVSPGTNPPSSGISVTGNLGSIGGSSTQQFYDDGSHGDATGGDGIFSFSAAVPAGTGAGLKSLPITVSDAQTRSSSTNIALTIQPPPPPNTVKISQVYGGGGNSGATYTNDFIEIFNNSNAPVDISGWSVQYSSATITTWVATPICPQSGCVIPPYHYFLVQESAGAGGTTAPPPADVVGSIALSGTQAKVALVASSDVLNGACGTGGPIVDFVGYGGANCSETNPTPVLSNTTAALRRNNGCIDTDNNQNDFIIDGPIPRNSSSPANFCGATGQLSGQGLATPDFQLPATDSLLTVAVSPATGPASTGISVAADLTAFNGNSAQPFFDDGTHGDVTAGDGVFSFSAPAPLTTGLHNAVAMIADAQGRNASAPITMTVVSPTCGVERWTVKVGTDPDATSVDLSTLIRSTVADLGAIPPPANPPDNARVFPTEGHEFVINGTLMQYKLETDVDYHIVVDDGTGRTMIVEIPNPACILDNNAPRNFVNGPFNAAIAAARQKFDNKLTAQTFFQIANIPVQIKGVAFFDFEHGQTGIAPNAIELHPVLEINFPNVSTVTLVSNTDPSQLNQNVTLTAAVTGGSSTATGNVTFQDGGNPIGVAPLNAAGQASFTTSALTVGTHSLRASYEGDSTSSNSVSAPLLQQVNPANQTITFAPIGNHLTTDAPFTVSASASSGLPVSFSIVSGPATISGNTITLTGTTGTVVVQASQGGNGNYNAAPSVTQSFQVSVPFAQLTFVASTVNTGSGYQVTLTVKNPGNVDLSGVNLIAATLGSAGGTPLPQALGTITGNGGTATAVLNFPLSAGVPKSAVIGKFTVTSSSGNFSGSIKIVLPVVTVL